MELLLPKKGNETKLDLDKESYWLVDDYADPVLSAGNFTLFASILPLYTNLLAILH
jgi:hypothetical protein